MQNSKYQNELARAMKEAKAIVKKGDYDLILGCKLRAPCNITPDNLVIFNLMTNKILSVRYKCGQYKWRLIWQKKKDRTM
jgi:hypothetical protein